MRRRSSDTRGLTPVWSETRGRRLRAADGATPPSATIDVAGDPRGARIGFRQPVLRVALEKRGRTFDTTWQDHEAAGSGRCGGRRVLDRAVVRRSRRRSASGNIRVAVPAGREAAHRRVLSRMFENSVPGLPEAARREGLAPLEYMRKYGAFLVEDHVYGPTSSRRQRRRRRRRCAARFSHAVLQEAEFFSKTLKDWKWPEHAVPGYIRSHVHWSKSIARGRDGAAAHVPAAHADHKRAPATRSGSNEISHTNPRGCIQRMTPVLASAQVTCSRLPPHRLFVDKVG